MKIEFQYLAKGELRPNDLTLSDAGYTVDPGEPIPEIGDCIMIQVCSPAEQVGAYKHCKVLARHFWYSNTERKQLKNMIIVVTDADDIPENNFRE